MRVLVIVHESLIPPTENKIDRIEYEKSEWSTEYDVIRTLKALGHNVEVLGLLDDLSVLRKKIEVFRPHTVFNLLEEFAGEAIFEQNIVSYLELMGVSVTGCNPKGLIISRDKALAKKIMTFHNVPTPKFVELKYGKKLSENLKLQYPLIVKMVNEEASLGIDEKSVVKNWSQLEKKVNYLRYHYSADLLIEEFIDGRELYMGVIGNKNLSSFKCWELFFNQNHLNVATERVKWDFDYRKENNIKIGPAKSLDSTLENKIVKSCKNAYRALNLSGYARFDIRLTDKGEIYFLEANPNPDIGQFEEFSMSAKVNGVKYEQLLQKILNLSLMH